MAKNPTEAPRAEPEAPRDKPRLHQRYLRDVVPALVKDFNYSNPMQVPKVAKVSVNVGVGEAIANAKALDATVRDVSIITGQKPLIKKARKSIAQFKLREGQNVGVMVTLRGERMWEFLDRLMNAALPRTRDFRGVPSRSFDGRGSANSSFSPRSTTTRSTKRAASKSRSSPPPDRTRKAGACSSCSACRSSAKGRASHRWRHVQLRGGGVSFI